MSRLTGLLSIIFPMVSAGTVYVRTGANITDCQMKCLHPDDTPELYRRCGESKKTLMMYSCYNKVHRPYIPRIHLNTNSSCWTLTDAEKNDSCVYKIWYHSAPGYPEPSTDIRVLDPILISNITSNCSRLGQDIAVSVQYSGEESAVTWEVDGEPLPERYRLIDDNRTLIIPSVQRNDAKRTFRVRITNPVSKEIRDHQLEIRDSVPHERNRGITVAIVGVVLVILMGIIYMIFRNRSSYVIPETLTLNGVSFGPVPTDIPDESVQEVLATGPSPPSDATTESNGGDRDHVIYCVTTDTSK